MSRLISITLSNEIIRLCEVDKKKSGVMVFWTDSIEMPENAYVDGSIKDMQAVAGAIKENLSKRKVKAKEVVFSIMASLITSKDLVLPIVKPEKIKPMLETNSTDYFTFNANVEKYVYGYSLLGKGIDKKKKEIRCLAIAAPEDIVDSYYVLAKEIGLKVNSIDYAGNSRLQILEKLVSDEPTVIIQVGDYDSSVTILKNKSLELQRTIAYGLENTVLPAAMSAYGIEREDALFKLATEKTLYAHLKPDDNETFGMSEEQKNQFAAVTGSLRLMANSIKRVIKYYTDQQNKAKASEEENQETENTENTMEASNASSEDNDFNNMEARLIVSTCKVYGLEEVISNEIGYNTKYFTELTGVNLSKNTSDNLEIMNYLDNIGAVINPMGITSLAQENTEAKKSGNSNNRALIIGSIFIAALLVGYPAWEYQNALADKEALLAKIEQVKGAQDVVDQYYDSADKLTDALNFANMTTNNNESARYIIGKLEEIVPSDMSIDTLAVSDGSVSLSAKCSSKSCVAKFLEELDKLENVYDVKIAGVTETINDDEITIDSFSLAFNFTNLNESYIYDETGRIKFIPQEEPETSEESVKEAK